MSNVDQQDPTAGSLPVLSIAGARAEIRLNRPRQHNRIEPCDLAVIDGYLDRLAQDKSLRLVVLTGTGEKTFSSGYSLNALDANAPGSVGRPAISLETVIDKLEDLPQPTVCAMNGSIYGAATDFALACDFRIGVRGISMVMPAAKIGIHYYAQGMRRYVERLGLTTAKRLFMSAEKIDSDEMLRIGFLDAAVERAELAARIDDMLRTYEHLAPNAVQGMKRDLNLIARGRFDAQEMNRSGFERSLLSADLAEGLAAHEEKRAPKFSLPD
ncbi:enoyl-CoA hydratase/isomerase family protein [Noviherbaspirillum sedimenti]|uniref:Enoyl-CoA hydratase/isomerase family protein n=1 Tax=Noviherbaspirillum sedimenti TaxID=2320865 RepID=A0A3A3FZU3_9BURK|nr:enoyl-CoA hydratase/isomerase family protein [Noviherbaspirillum sedimenti]RJG00179.1 enoyl-CoA hydratase/isomerase family protein [Noviherbaspirillum sedimenti]